ncbi:MAG: aminotransferase class I/II-fold pyridoxal phosphate-dependent enzyme [Clostridiales bacterium]|nr:aminotransferase class I/II-fold pyridoxal phosphate-dependent enzyme [Clostridiales bacterium]
MRPIHDMLRTASGRRSFHMPGHKGAAPFGPEDLYALDTTEIPLTDDLYCPENGIARAQELYARAAGAAETIFLHNGSTAGIHAMVQLYAGEGDTVILPRNAHLSAANGCVLGGVRAAWIPITQRADGYCYIAEEDALSALDKHPEAKAMLLTRPDFYGGCLPLTRVIEKAHAMGIRIVVDEAHGAHLPWLKEVASAGELGADAWVQSVHKTLPGLTGSAALHLRSAEDKPRAMRILRREQTSSPSFVLLASIDDSRAYMEETGEDRLAAIAAAADELRRLLPETGYADAHAAWADTGLLFDPTRLVIEAPQGGFALAKILRENGVDVEMADIRRVVLILSAMDEPEDVLRLAEILRANPPRAAELPVLPDMRTLPEKALDLRVAVMAPCEAVPLAEAQGCVAAASAGLYPPGIPLVCPGEKISAEILNLLRNAGTRERFGLEGDNLLCVKL